MALRPARRRGSTDQLDYGCGRDAAGLEAADRAGDGASFPRRLSQLRPVDGQFRVRYRKCGQEGVLAASRTVPDNRLRPISLSRSGCSGEPIFNYRTGGERICITSRNSLTAGLICLRPPPSRIARTSPPLSQVYLFARQCRGQSVSARVLGAKVSRSFRS